MAFAVSADGFNPQDTVTELPPAETWSRFTHAGTIVGNSQIRNARRRLGQAPAFLTCHAPSNYTAQLPVAFDNQCPS